MLTENVFILQWIRMLNTIQNNDNDNTTDNRIYPRSRVLF